MKRHSIFIIILLSIFRLIGQTGSIDYSFNSSDSGFGYGDGPNQLVRTIAVQNNEQIIIGGDFTTYNGVSINRIARIQINGDLDTTFNIGSGFNSNVYSIVIQQDGKIIVGGQFTTFNGISCNRIIRLNQNGNLDATFTPLSGPNGTIQAIELQPDGKILIAGAFTTYDGTSINRIARLNTDGTLDLMFTPGTAANNTINSIAIQTDGKILLAGNFTSYNGTTRGRITRINSDGTLDATFVPGSGANNTIHKLAIQNDGKIVIVGAFTSYAGISRNRVARVNSDGLNDSSFNPGSGTNNEIHFCMIQPDNKIVLGGNFSNFNNTLKLNIVRVLSTGAIDPDFTVDYPGASGPVLCLGVQSDHKILVGGNFTDGYGIPRNRIARLQQDGASDPTFNPGSGASLLVKSINIHYGKILISGNFTHYNGIQGNHIARINSDGTFDNSFYSGPGANSFIQTVSIQADQKIIIGGSFVKYDNIPRNYIARLNADGTLDSSFNPGTGTDGAVFSSAVQSDGKILIGGSFYSFNGTSRNNIARINEDGTLDTSFDPGTGFDAAVNVIKVQSDGKILVGGSFLSYNGTAKNYLVRLNSDGSIDPTFAGSTNGEVYAIAVHYNGKILIGGNFFAYNGSVRNNFVCVNDDGSIDWSFYHSTGANGIVRSIIVDGGGMIILGGQFTTYNNQNRNRIVRLYYDGNLDIGFDPGTGANNSIFSLAIQWDGRILIGGDFTSYNNVGRNRVARIFQDCGYSSISAVTSWTNNICSHDTITLVAQNVSIGSGATLTWYDGPNGTGNNLGTGNPKTFSPSVSTTYFARLAGSCNTVEVLKHIQVKPSYSVQNLITICQGSSYQVNGNEYTTAGIYSDTLHTLLGCDSIVITELSVDSGFQITEYDTICPGGSVHWHGNNYSIPGTYTASYQTNNGCDSIYVLHLTEKQCQGQFCDWQHYRKITVNNQQNSENLTDYTVLVIMNTATLITESKVKPDGSDIRFTTNFSDDLEYWIESGIQNEHGMNDDSTHIWVKIPYIPALSGQNLYLLYGNPTATARSNISNTFLFGDDFNDNSVDTSKWNQYIYGIGQIIEQNNRLEHNSPKSNPESGTQLFSKQSFTGPVVVDIQFKKGGHLYRGTGLRLDHDQTSYGAWINWQDWGGFGPSVTVNSVTQNTDFRNDSWSRYNNPEYYLHIYRKPDSTFRFVAHIPPFEQDGYKYWQHTFTTAKMPLDQPLKVGSYEWVWKYAGTMWIRYEDNIRIRKYTEPEPYCQLFDELPVSSPANLTFDTICEGDSIFWRENYYSSTGTYTDSLLSITGCDSVLVLNLTVKQPLIPIFGAVPDLCAGDPVNPLPAFSENGIEGTWLPAFDNTQTTMYVFTPQPGQCAVSTELLVTVIPQSEGGILSGPYSEICTGESIGFLSISNYIGNIIRWERSDDGGVTWMNLGNNSDTYMEIPGVPGTRMYRVVILNNPCDIAYSNIHTIIIHPVILPLFDAISPVCEGDYISSLPVLSNNGITGSWSPAPDNMQTTLYTFTSDPGQCAVNTQITIEVNPVYLFETDIELCSGDTCFWRGDSYNQPGVYYDSLLTQYGCDSIYILTLSYYNLPLDINNSTPILFSEKISDANTIVLDHLNNTTTGQLYGALSYVQSVPGLSVAGNFSSGQWIRYGYNANLRDAGTFDMWIYPTAYSTPLANINYSNTATTYPGSGHVFHLDLNASGKIVMSNWPGTGLSTLESNSVIPLNQWTHVAVAWGDSTIIYINGKIDNSNPGSFRPSAYGNYSIRIPKWGSPYPVYIDEIHVSNIRRTLQEIRSGYIFYNVNTDATAVCSGSSTNINIINPQSGIQYTLFKNNTVSGQPQEGIGNLLSFSTGPLMQTSGFKIKAENISTGCSIFLDTVITISIHENYNFVDSTEICSWQTYEWHGQSLNTAGTYYDNHTTINGCDSNYVLHLSHRTPVPEICNDIDDDCDGVVDEGVQNIYYADNDGDGYGAGPIIFACVQPPGTSTNNTDCDDTDFSRHEGIVIYLDSDNDGYHVAPEITICMGDQIPPGYKLFTLGIDCNDQNPNVHPGATEICNGIDDDCDGAVDEDLIAPLCDKQYGVCEGSRKTCGGVNGWLVCSDVIYEAHNPNFEINEISCDGLDNDCDGQTDEGVQNIYYADNDGDGYGAGPEILACLQPQGTVTNNFDCDDTKNYVYPGAQEICGNGIDDNCDGQIDECFTLTVSKQGNGNGNVSTNPSGINCGPICSFTFPAGTIVTVQATPDAISEFSGWSGACTGTGTCQITMNNNKQISALFTKKYFTVSVTKTGSGNGTVSSTPAGISCGTICTANYEAGMMITLTAQAEYGSAQFTGWGGDAASCGTSQTCQLYVYSNINVITSFECLTPAAAGTISGPAEVCPDGSIYTFSVPPITHATSYVWNLPAGCISSSTTNSINVIFTDTAQSGIISVYGQNVCASGEPSSLQVNIIGVEIEILNGSNQVCAGESVTIHANATGGTNYEYQWFVNDVPLTYGHTNKQNQVLFCPLDGNANDVSGNGINGIVHNAIPTSDRFGNPGGALYFNGNSSWIDLGDHDSLNLHYGNISISAWAKKSVLNQHSRIYSKGTHCGTQPGYDLMFYGWGTPSRAACIFAAGGHEHIVYSNTAIADTNWHHYVGTIDRSGYVHLYVDGIKQNDSIFIGNHNQEDIALNTFNAAIGASYSYCGNPGMVNEFVNGSIDEVVLYKRVLSAAEVEHLYHLQSTPEISFNPNDGDLLQCVANINQICTVESNFLLFDILSTPEMAGSISGPDTVFAGTSVMYSVPIIQHATSYLWTLPQGLSGSSTTNSIMAEVGTSSGSGVISVQGINTCGSGAVSEFTIEMMIPTKYLSLKVFLESLYNSQHQLNETKNNLNQPQWGSGITDILLIELFESNDLNTPFYSKDSVFLKTDGYTDIIEILNALPMEYYIVVKHRNSIETWSSGPVTLSGTDSLFYDFTDSALKAYGSNMKSVAGGNFAVWSGDVNQDGVVDATDISNIDNGITIILSGYNPEDINGDGRVDASDMSFVDNNSLAPPKQVKRPW